MPSKPLESHKVAIGKDGKTKLVPKPGKRSVSQAIAEKKSKKTKVVRRPPLR